jgi:hypothetical protein
MDRKRCDLTVRESRLSNHPVKMLNMLPVILAFDSVDVTWTFSKVEIVLMAPMPMRLIVA